MTVAEMEAVEQREASRRAYVESIIDPNRVMNAHEFRFKSTAFRLRLAKVEKDFAAPVLPPEPEDVPAVFDEAYPPLAELLSNWS